MESNSTNQRNTDLGGDYQSDNENGESVDIAMSATEDEESSRSELELAEQSLRSSRQSEKKC